MEKISLPARYRSNLLRRFCRYVTVNTQSDDKVEDRCPTTRCQFGLAEMLVEELGRMGVGGAHVDEFGYVYATIPANIPDGHPATGKVPAIGLMSHLDTASEEPGEDVVPQVIKRYDGGDIRFPDDPALVLRASECPELKRCLGHTVITASGRTLLGADDKAGIAEIMTVVEYLIREDIPHGEIRVCFNPDEETGHGTSHIDLNSFAVRCAYTLDGGAEGEIEDECFNADLAKVTITGVNMHPGYAKGKMVNALRVLAWVIGHLPPLRSPETTEGRQPYLHPKNCPTPPEVGRAELELLVRAYTDEEFEEMKKALRRVCSRAERAFPGSQVAVEFSRTYRNMKEVLDRHPLVMGALEEACRVQGVAPVHKPIRGGTDGSALSVNYGIPTPNVWAGGVNFHSRTEWASLEWMVSATETMLTTLALWVERCSS